MENKRIDWTQYPIDQKVSQSKIRTCPKCGLHGYLTGGKMIHYDNTNNVLGNKRLFSDGDYCVIKAR